MAHVHYDRRKGRDLLSRCISHAAMAGWLLLTSTLLIFHLARPDKRGDRYWKPGESTSWDVETGQYLLYVCILGLAMALAGLFINILRNRRKRDFIHINLIVLALASIFGIVLYIVNF